jgi:hypothetical protein
MSSLKKFDGSSASCGMVLDGFGEEVGPREPMRPLMKEDHAVKVVLEVVRTMKTGVMISRQTETGMETDTSSLCSLDLNPSLEHFVIGGRSPCLQISRPFTKLIFSKALS